MNVTKTVVVMGGSFNPIHLGHVEIAKRVYVDLNSTGHSVDEVWLLPSKQNPMKSPKELAPFDDRMNMCVLAIEGEPDWLKVYPYEQDVSELFTYFTIRHLQSKFPGYQFVWLMGSDNMVVFHEWDYGEELAEIIPIIIYGRDCSTTGLLQTKTALKYKNNTYQISDSFEKLPNWRIMESAVEGRSTHIREDVKNNVVSKTLNGSVWGYISKNKLYT